MSTKPENSIREVSQDEIARCAYDLWEREGRPEGRSTDHWIQAESLLRAGIRPQQQETHARKAAAPRAQSSRIQANGGRREKRVEMAA